MTLRENCALKIADAKHHCQQMQTNVENYNDFRRELAACVTAIRSPMQYIYRAIPRGSAADHWYEATMNNSDVLEFFREERNLEIHEAPVMPANHIHDYALVRSPKTRCLSNVWEVDANGNQTLLSVSGDLDFDNPEPMPEEIPSVRTHTYFFTRWTATPDAEVLALTAQCILEVEQAVQEAINLNHI